MFKEHGALRTPTFLVEWSLPPELSRGRHGEFRKQPPDAYAKLPNCDWISVYLSVDMCKRYCLYEAESEEAASEARNGANAKIDKIVRVDALAESELRE